MMYDGVRPCGEWNTNGIDPFKLIKDCIFAASVLSTLCTYHMSYVIMIFLEWFVLTGP
jgi:hypothetical protein